MKKYWNRVATNMNIMDQHERGLRIKPKNYEIFRMFSPHAYYMQGGYGDDSNVRGKGGKYYNSDRDIISKLHTRFPSLKVMPNIMFM